MSNSPLSTSALAKALDKTTKQMFSELDSLGWIERKNDSWQLTTKGEFEGGCYRESQKFGRYIIWPADVIEHQALASPDAQLMSAAKLAKSFSLSTTAMEQILSEIGWIRASKKGWELTQQGAAEGGCQRESSQTAIPFVLWSSDVTGHPVLTLFVSEHQNEHDLSCCDGHVVRSRQELKIDNWLYFSGLVHAYKRRLPYSEELYADFYLPQYHLYIEYWGEGNIASELSKKMLKKERLQQSGYKLIELQDHDVEQLEVVLPRLLLKYGIEI